MVSPKEPAAVTAAAAAAAAALDLRARPPNLGDTRTGGSPPPFFPVQRPVPDCAVGELPPLCAGPAWASPSFF